ncbi:MAG: malate synthase A [Myxococcaceae bacterium]|nr:malate synthase A [Myxococcaceae bacterium]
MGLKGVTLKGASSKLLSDAALEFLASLQRQFKELRRECLKARGSRPEAFNFLPASPAQTGDWKIAPVPPQLLDRRVEITGPAEAKMVINALNSRAKVFMADFEDSLTPTWGNIVSGQEALYEAVRRTLTFSSETGKQYTLNERLATLFVRPRGWHLEEAHLLVDEHPMSASLFDFGLFFFHNAKEQLLRGEGPFFYLPKIESHLEARLWNDVFIFAQNALGIPRGTIKATVLIETLPAAFEMEEILFELKEHSAGLNCGRWDYIFSFIKSRPRVLLPDRASLGMDKGFLRAYVQRLIQICHRRGAHAMGGMAAFIPIKDDAAANEAALEKVRTDKQREVLDGHDGTWVAHPGLISVAQNVFDAHMKGPNQLGVLRNDVKTTVDDLLTVPAGERTDAGLRHNIRVGTRYLEAWLRGQGCVPLYNLMEDAATAEISRAQVWQAVHLDGLSAQALTQVMEEELAPFAHGRMKEAMALFRQLSTAPAFAPFLTVPAYEQLLNEGQ